MEILIGPSGKIRHIYSDDLTGLFEEDGEVVTTRASNVEPDGNLWSADLSPLNGPVLRGFRLRQEALDAETEWIREHLAR